MKPKYVSEVEVTELTNGLDVDWRKGEDRAFLLGLDNWVHVGRVN